MRRTLLGQMKPIPFLFALTALIGSAAAQPAAESQRRMPSTHAAKPACTLSKPFLTSTSWRLYLAGLQLLRGSGVAIRLNGDGKVVSDSIAWLERWRIEPDDSLTLREPDGTVAYQFRLDPDTCLLSSLVCEDPAAKVAVMGRKGTDFAGYLARKCPQRFAKHPS